VREVEPPEPPVNPDVIFGNVRRRTFTPEEFGEFLAAARPFYRDHFIAQAGTGLRPGELLGLRRRRVQPERHRIEVLEVRYEAGKFGRGFKERPKSAASIRVVPMADAVRDAIVRQLPPGGDPNDLVFAGPGGNRWAKRGTRPVLSTHNYRRAYKAAIVRKGKSPDGTVTIQPRFPHLDLHGPHDLRHTFATWLEEAGIPSRVIDEVMGHVGTKRERASGSSPMGRVYRETTEAMAIRVTTVLDERLALACKIAGNVLHADLRS
jgi:integrase